MKLLQIQKLEKIQYDVVSDKGFLQIETKLFQKRLEAVKQNEKEKK